MEYFPVDFTAELSKKEANGKKPIYAVHKWFGRKTDAIIRSILITMFTEVQDINFGEKYYSTCHDLLKGKIILDPFMGGGISLINTLRMGGKAVGVDINPVACFITKSELQIPEINGHIPDYKELVKSLDNELHKLEATVGAEIKAAYKTTITLSEGACREADVMYVLWVKKIKCPECGNMIKLFPRYSITDVKKDMFENINVCPSCGEIVRGNEIKLTCSCCGLQFNIKDSCYKGRNFKCNCCGGTFSIIGDVMRKTSAVMDMEMYAIEYYDEKTGIKGFKKPDKLDIENYEKIKTQYNNYKDELREYIPCGNIPDGFNTRQILNHNYHKWCDMFNERQLFFLSKLLREISKIENQYIKEIFLCIFSNTLNANNMFSIYNSQYCKIEPIFGDHHLAPVMNPVENNIWGTRYGRGSFIKNYKLMLESKRYNYEPFERCYKGIKSIKTYITTEQFHGKFSEDFEKLGYSEVNTLIKCASAEELSFIPDNSVDGIVTDPPYYSAINYGEISEFFYCWQRIILSKNYPEFMPLNISFSNEVTVNHIKGIEKQQFQTRLTACFRELHRVLKQEAPLVMTYNNSSMDGWCVLVDSLKDSGFKISEVYPVYMEYNAGLVDNRRQKMNYDLIIFAVKSVWEAARNISFKDFLEELETQECEAVENCTELNLNEMDKKLIEVGALYKLFFKYYPNIYENGRNIEFQDIIKHIYKKA